MDVKSLIRESILGTPNAPALVLLHGLGSNEEDLFGLAPYLDPRLRIISLRAPNSFEFGGYAWFNVEWIAEGRRHDSRQALESLEMLVSFLTELRNQPGQIIVAGFSQGAMMTLGLLLKRPDLMDGAILMSGAVVPEFVPEVPLSATQGIPCLVQHGTLDPVLAVVEGRSIAELLVRINANYTYREYDMAHEVSSESLADIGSWLEGVIR